MPEKGDVVLTTEAPLGEVAQLDHQKVALAQRIVTLRGKPDLLDNTFLKFLFQSNEVQSELRARASGTTVVGIKQSELRKITLTLPPLPEQRRIAKILGDLDDKIELNRKMNETLEQMARALFKSWFIDFDPVRAKMEGRQPTGMDADTAALFPSRLVESELGLIPEGWEVGRIGDIVDVSRESVNPAAFPDEQFDHYSLPAFDEGRKPICEIGSNIKSNKLVVAKDAVLMSKLNPHIPRTWLPDVSAERRSVCSTEFIVAIAKNGFSREYVFSVFTSPDFMTTYGTLVTGTTGSHQRIKTESLLAIAQVTPPQRLIQEFSDRIKPAFQQLQSNINQSRTLASLRDTLLPQLMRGEDVVRRY
jgi:type I restriction enzyme S subunit